MYRRDWQPEVAVAPWATIDSDRVTIHGVRIFDYRTETDFVARWEDRTFGHRLDTPPWYGISSYQK